MPKRTTAAQKPGRPQPSPHATCRRTFRHPSNAVRPTRLTIPAFLAIYIQALSLPNGTCKWTIPAGLLVRLVYSTGLNRDSQFAPFTPAVGPFHGFQPPQSRNTRSQPARLHPLHNTMRYGTCGQGIPGCPDCSRRNAVTPPQQRAPPRLPHALLQRRWRAPLLPASLPPLARSRQNARWAQPNPRLPPPCTSATSTCHWFRRTAHRHVRPAERAFCVAEHLVMEGAHRLPRLRLPYIPCCSAASACACASSRSRTGTYTAQPQRPPAKAP